MSAKADLSRLEQVYPHTHTTTNFATTLMRVHSSALAFKTSIHPPPGFRLQGDSAVSENNAHGCRDWDA
eukprot:353608-Chlamydomonas_euryale.AAC.7